MSVVSPASAHVRPRVNSRDGGGTRPLEDVVCEIADEVSCGVVWVLGGPGCGKTTALSHLASIFEHEVRFSFLDEPSGSEVDAHADCSLVVATSSSQVPRSGVVLRLSTWGADELVELLLAKHSEQCRSVFSRLGAAAHTSWNPELACVVLGRLAEEPLLLDPTGAIIREIELRLPEAAHRLLAAEFCLAKLVSEEQVWKAAWESLQRVRCPQQASRLLRYPSVQLPLAADRLVGKLSTSKSTRVLKQKLPSDLIEQTARRCRENESAIDNLRKMLVQTDDTASHPAAASILAAADKHWHPIRKSIEPWFLCEAHLRGVAWSRVSLNKADLRKADFSDAELIRADFEQGQLEAATFVNANLNAARLVGVTAAQADFSFANLSAAIMSLGQFIRASFHDADLSRAAVVRADLTSADFSNANLVHADFCGAQLRGACFNDSDLTNTQFDEADLTNVDLRSAILLGTSFREAKLTHAKLDDVVFPGANLRGASLQHAHLTGSALPLADMRHALLSYSHLAEVNWEGADLRNADLCGASFHMGSSRSGLVGSPIACEGSKTGFYTDDREELYFKRPEEIRKANLRRTDLRGANLTSVDFYLVDLREAKLDPDQSKLARKSGAILDGWEA